MKTISFERNSWGHAMHGWTFRKVDPMRGWLQRWKDKRANRRYFSVLVHSREVPFTGDLVRYPSYNGLSTAQVFAVRPMGDPDDMYELTLMRGLPFDLKYNVIPNAEAA